MTFNQNNPPITSPVQTVNQGRNAAKRAARARIHKGPAKTPKGMKGQ